MTKSERLKKYQTLPENIKELYSSDATMFLNMTLTQKYSIEKIPQYVDCIGDTILGFYQTKDLPALLQQEVGVSADVSQRIVADLAEFLAPVLEREALAADPKKAGLKALKQQFGNPNTPPAAARPTPPSEPNEDSATVVSPEPEPEELHNVTPMRTMAADMTRVHGYGAYRQVETVSDTPTIKSASQEDLLKQRPKLTNIPKVGE